MSDDSTGSGATLVGPYDIAVEANHSLIVADVDHDKIVLLIRLLASVPLYLVVLTDSKRILLLEVA